MIVTAKAVVQNARATGVSILAEMRRLRAIAREHESQLEVHVERPDGRPVCGITDIPYDMSLATHADRVYAVDQDGTKRLLKSRDGHG